MSYNSKNTNNGNDDRVNALKYVVIGGVVLGIGAYVSTRYKTSLSNQWLVKTGLLVNDIQIGKKFFELPYQDVRIINVSPRPYQFNINSMSKEKMEFRFPFTVTLGPKTDDESLTKYARLMVNAEDEDKIVKGVVEGEARALAANLPIEDIFTGRKKFKDDIVKHVQSHMVLLFIMPILKN
jgi:flotillin